MSRLAAIRVPSRFGVVLGLLAAAGALIADTVLVPRVELRELEDGRYSLEAELSRLVVGRIQEAVLPARCAPVSDAVLRPDSPIFRWRLDFACSERLDRSDEIYLPWMVDGVQMTARWADGDVQRGLFGREGPGVRLPLDLLKLRSTSIGALVGRYLVPGALHVFKVWPHLLLILLLGLALPAARLIPVLAGITGGHALALVLAESGVVGVPTAPAEATVALAALVLAAAVIREATIGREAVVIGGIVGIVHGLGLATELAGSALLGDRFVPALFLTSLGVDLVTWGLGIGLALVWSAVGNPGRHCRNH